MKLYGSDDWDCHCSFGSQNNRQTAEDNESSREMVPYTCFVGLICRYDFHIFSVSPLSDHSISKMLCANYICIQRHFWSILLACEVHIISLWNNHNKLTKWSVLPDFDHLINEMLTFFVHYYCNEIENKFLNKFCKLI